MGAGGWISEGAGGVVMRICIQPRASKCRVVGMLGDELKVSVTAPPVDGAANEMLTGFLAALLSVPRGSVNIRSGESSRHKLVAVSGVNASRVKTSLGLP
ncbi:MAG: DUF167 family protein [Myxococcota bacterium]|jgi:hypothetical protein